MHIIYPILSVNNRHARSLTRIEIFSKTKHMDDWKRYIINKCVKSGRSGPIFKFKALWLYSWKTIAVRTYPSVRTYPDCPYIKLRILVAPWEKSILSILAYMVLLIYRTLLLHFFIPVSNFYCKKKQ